MSRLARKSLLCICALALLLQGAVTVAMPCDAMSIASPTDPAHAHHQAHDSALPDHAVHDAADVVAPASCCDEGYCSIGGCVSMAAVPQGGLPPEAPRLLEGSEAPLYNLLSRIPSSPYRPPALA